MPNTGNNGNRALGNGAGDRFVVETHEVLERASASNEEHGVRVGRSGNSKSANNGRRGPCALHAATNDIDKDQGVPSRERALDVLYNRA